MGCGDTDMELWAIGEGVGLGLERDGPFPFCKDSMEDITKMWKQVTEGNRKKGQPKNKPQHK